MIRKIASTIEFSFIIPESEKQEAKLASDTLKRVISALDVAKQHLDIIYNPFQDGGEINPEELNKMRGAIFRYKEQILENFNKVKAISFLSIMHLNSFSSDNHVTELVNSFKDSIEAVENQVTILCDCLDDLKNKDFKQNVIKAIESIRKECFDTETMINDRVIDYLDTNILAEDWVTNTGNRLNTQIESKIPYITRLFEERRQMLEGK